MSSLIWGNVWMWMTSFSAKNLSHLKLYIINRKFKFCEWICHFSSHEAKQCIFHLWLRHSWNLLNLNILCNAFLSLKIIFVLTNSADSDKMLHNMQHFILVFTVRLHILESLLYKGLKSDYTYAVSTKISWAGPLLFCRFVSMNTTWY